MSTFAASAPAMTVIDMRNLPGGPRAATADNRWPCPLEPGERETAYDMEYAEVEEGEVMQLDLASEYTGRVGLVPVRECTCRIPAS